MIIVARPVTALVTRAAAILKVSLSRIITRIAEERMHRARAEIERYRRMHTQSSKDGGDRRPAR